MYIAKSKTSSFIVERRILTTKDDEFFLEKKFQICEKIYNTAVKYYKKQINELYKDVWYIQCLHKFKNSKTEEEKKLWSNEIFVCMSAYNLTEYDIHMFMGKQKVSNFSKSIGINIVQKLGTNLYSAIKKAVFKGTKIHYRKRGQTNSFEDKKAKSGIIYNTKGTVKIMGKVMKLKSIRENDVYLQEAMCHKIKYCRVVKKPFAYGYKYFLQIVMEGNAPKKLTLGKGFCGVDQGTSTIAYYNNNETNFVVLAEDVETYNKEIKHWVTVFDRRKRLHNPQCYNKDGTIIKGSKFYYTKNCKKALMQLKNAYRKKSVYIKQEHNKLANRLVEQCDTIVKEPMNFKALQKRSKNTKRQEISSTITKKDGTKINVYKYKRKKRFGKSLQNRSPGLLNQIIENKFQQYKGFVIEVNSKEYKASQYDHTTEQATKCKLSDRSKIIGEYLVQRDLYSAFLLYNMLDTNKIDFQKCKQNFNDFLEKQELVINRIKVMGDITNNFGIKDFNF